MWAFLATATIPSEELTAPWMTVEIPIVTSLSAERLPKIVFSSPTVAEYARMFP